MDQEHETAEQAEVTTEQVDQIATTSEESQEIDYKAELDKATHNRSGYEQRKSKETTEEDVETDIDIKQTIKDVIREELSASRQESVESNVQTQLAGITDSNERALVEHHYRNTIRTSGNTQANIQQDINAARAIANASRLVKENKELKVASTTRANMASDSSASGHVVNTPTDKNWTKDQLEHFAKRGVNPADVLETLKKQQR